MSDLRKAAEMALDALERCEYGVISNGRLKDTIQALRQALTQPEQKREWVGLTDEEVEAWRGNYDFFDSALVKEVEAKLKEKNT